MKLIVPYIDNIRSADARLLKLAEFLGIACMTSPVEPNAGLGWRTSVFDDGSDVCLLINPDVIHQCLCGQLPSPESVTWLLSHFRRLLVHSVRPDPFHAALIAALTNGCFHDVRRARDCRAFVISAESRSVCASFAGLSIPASSLEGDCVFSGGDTAGCRKFITVDQDAFFASYKSGIAEVLMVGSGEVVNLDAEASAKWLTETFSCFVPYAMALRHVFGDECWRPVEVNASVIIDDPLLRPNYGFLNFERLLRLMEEHNFTSTIAFIPHNFRRNSRRVIRLFQQNPHRFSLCFHGNDHLGAEFAATDPALINTMLQIAQRRMTAFTRMTTVPCDRIMVFPQGKFSVDAMAGLGSQNFDAAVNTIPHPCGQPLQLTLREFAEPAVIRYSGFPLFLRMYSRDLKDADIAFKLFFGIPILIVEHHDIFENPQILIDAVDRINLLAPEICWSGAGDAVKNAYLRRRSPSGPVQLKAYARRIQVKNPGSLPQRFYFEWGYTGSRSSLDGVYCKDQRCPDCSVGETGISVSAEVNPGGCESLSLRNVQNEGDLARVGLRYTMRAFIRRRLSEVRDNFVSKRPALLATAKSLQRRLQH